MLLGISIDGVVQPDPKPPAEGGSRIDAAILPPHGGLLVIETKVVPYLDPHQLARHRKLWKINRNQIVAARWLEIWEWAREQRDVAADPVTRFLLTQFCDYLEILGFGRWAGFREEDFEQFVDWSWDHQPVLRARMHAAWERVLELMPAAEAQRLRPIEAGRLPRQADTAWAQTNRGQSGANLTLQLGSDELQMNIVGWKGAQASRLAAWLETTPERAPDLELVIYKRRPVTDHKGEPYWMRETLKEVRRFSPADIRSGDFAPWVKKWTARADLKWARLAYHLRRTWPREEVLARGEDLAGEIAELASQAIPILRAINGWK